MATNSNESNIYIRPCKGPSNYQIKKITISEKKILKYFPETLNYFLQGKANHFGFSLNIKKTEKAFK